MKDVRLEWQKKEDVNADDILSIISWERGLEIAQLRRTYKDKCRKCHYPVSAYSKNVWFLAITHYDDGLVASHLGDDYEKDIHKGFESVYDFRDWMKDRQWRSNVFEKSY